MDLDTLRETALANFENLLFLWDLTFTKINANEYDIIAKWRGDQSHGGCRFNIIKARGADFAGGGFTKEELSAFGDGFDASDFIAYGELGATKIGFDIIGLRQRVGAHKTYAEARQALEKDLSDLPNKIELLEPARAAARRRAVEAEEAQKKARKIAKDMFQAARMIPWIGSEGEQYLQSRGIHITDLNMRFHPRMKHPNGKYYPCILLRVQNAYNGEFQAIHRIFLEKRDGKVFKANVDEPKLALAPTAGHGIWFGLPMNTNTLFIAEGPETALSLRQTGAEFVVSTLNATNFHNLTIPHFIDKIILVPDKDPAGQLAIQRAKAMYSKLNVPIIVCDFGMEDGEDYNDVLMRGVNG